MPTIRPRSLRLVSIGCALLAAALAAGAAAAAPTDPLETPVRAIWAGLPIRDWADRAGRVAGMPIVIDRRLDPDLTVSGTAAGEPLRGWLDRVAGSAGAVVEPLAATVRLVPAARGGGVRRAEEARRREIARLPAARRAALAVRRVWAWPAGARPRDLVAAAVAETGGAQGLDQVPHDHLPAASLPPLSLAERVDLVLAHYDLRMAWTDGSRGAVVPIGHGVDPSAPGPGRPRRPARGGPATAVEPRFTLSLAAPLDEAVRAVAAQFGLVPQIDRDALSARGVLPGEIVRARAVDATRDELLDALVAPLGLRWRIDGNRLVIDAAADGTPR